MQKKENIILRMLSSFFSDKCLRLKVGKMSTFSNNLFSEIAGQIKTNLSEASQESEIEYLLERSPKARWPVNLSLVKPKYLPGKMLASVQESGPLGSDLIKVM